MEEKIKIEIENYLDARGILFRTHFILIRDAVTGQYSEEKIREVVEALSAITLIKDEGIKKKYKKEITGLVKSGYNLEDLKEVSLNLLKLTEEERAYKGISGADMGLFESLLDIFIDLANNWMEGSSITSDNVVDCGLKTSAMIMAIKNIFSDDKFSDTLYLIGRAEDEGKMI